MNEIKLITDWPVAIDSPDYTHPWGVYRDNTLDVAFLLQLKNMYPPKNLPSILDLGCAGGKFIYFSSKMGMEAVGLEGSDYWVKKISDLPNEQDPESLKQWRELYNKNLFTCDISHPFTLMKNDEILKFDIISCWEVIEHIHPDRLVIFFENIKNHLKSNGLFVGSISTNHDDSSGIELHQSIKTREEWINLLNQHFVVERYNFRYSHRVDVGSFFVKLRLKTVFEKVENHEM